MIRVVVADDHAVVRAGLVQLLATFADVELVGAAADGEEAVALCAERQPNVVLMDLEMPVLDGIEATRRIRSSQPEVAVVVLTSFSDRERILRALDAGAAGYLLKDSQPAEVAAAVRSAHRGEIQLDPAVTRPLISDLKSGGDGVTSLLTSRELEVLRLVGAGKANKEIAADLVISERTARTHVSNVLRKIGVSSRTQAAVLAVREGLVAPAERDGAQPG